MNRRDFIRSFAAGVATVAIGMRLARGMPELPVFNYAEEGQRMAAALAKSMMQTKEIITANVLNKAFSDDGTMVMIDAKTSRLSTPLNISSMTSGEGARRSAGVGGSPGRF